MSKFVIRKHVTGFTIVSNNVIKVLKGDLQTLGLYVHLLSLPDNWEFYKTQLCTDCNLGINKLDRLLKKLASFGLVKTGQRRDGSGRFASFWMDIYDKEEIDAPRASSSHDETQMPLPNLEPFTSEEVRGTRQTDQELNEHVHAKTPIHRTTETVAPLQSPIKEVYINKNKTNNTCSSGDELIKKNTSRVLEETEMFILFFSLYPRKQNKKVALKSWHQYGCEKKFNLIMENIRHRIANEWKGRAKEHIPLASTYLANARWEDELITPYAAPTKQNHIGRAINYCLSTLEN